jgi:hypothetical protein
MSGGVRLLVRAGVLLASIVAAGYCWFVAAINRFYFPESAAGWLFEGLAIVAIPAGIGLAWIIRPRPFAAGRCVRCGYDLSAVGRGPCPECGYIKHPLV